MTTLTTEILETTCEMCDKYTSKNACSKMAMIDYTDYTDFQDFTKNNFTSDYADYAVIKSHYW